MAKEAVIRKKTIEILEAQRWLTWRAPKVKYNQTDIFGIFDIICWQKGTGKFKFIQLTTLSNLSTRRKKIQNFFKKNKINWKPRGKIKIELWAWNKRNKTFKIEQI